MQWKNALEELPNDNEYVACMKYHWKKCWPLSAEIIFGRVESYINEDNIRIAKVNTCDFIGHGLYCWSFPIDHQGDADHIDCWTYASEFKKPEFLQHNTWWGEEK